VTRDPALTISALLGACLLAMSAPAQAGPASEPDHDLPRTSPVSHPVRGGYLSANLGAVKVTDPSRYRLRPAPPGYAWVIVGHDLLLIQEKSGLIVDMIEGGAR